MRNTSRFEWLRRMALFAVAVATPFFMFSARAAQWPEREIHLVVPWSVGGPSDTFARIVAQELSKTLGQTVVVENKAGATGTIGVRHVARAKPDGYTLLFGNTVSLIGSVVFSAEPPQFDPVRDFVPVGLVVETSYILSAHPSAGVKNWQEFFKRITDANQPPLAVGSTGNGATSDIFYDWLIDRYKVRLTKIAFKGTGPLVSDLIAGHLPVGSAGLSLGSQYYREGKIFPLAIVGSARLPELPDVPSARELGLNAPDLTVWDGVFAPSGTPADVLARLSSALKQATESATFRDVARKNGSSAVFQGESEAARRLQKDLAERRQFKNDLQGKSTN